MIDILEHHTSAFHHAVERVFGHMEWNIELILETLAQTTQERTAAGQPDAVVHNVGIKLWRSVFKSSQNGRTMSA